MMSYSVYRNELLHLCIKALDGELNADDFYSMWPDNIEDSKFIAKLYDDIEDGVLHFPGHLFSNKPDYKAWRDSYMYITLYLDKLLLSSELSEEKLLELHDNILSEKGRLTVEMIDDRFKQLTNQ